MSFIYTLSVFGLKLGFRFLALFNEKAKLGLQGRQQSQFIVEKHLKGESVIWMHAASLGEYEQGLPVLEELKKNYPDYKILVTFFSPSGYENVKKKKHLADVVCYLPFDDKSTIQKFINTFDTKLFFTVKYDFWYNLLSELKKQKVPTVVVSALFYEGQIFFKMYGQWFTNQLIQNLDWAFHQTIKSSALAKSIGIVKSSVTGDTRFDRVKQIKDRNNEVAFIEDYISDRRCVVFGSSWETEEKVAQLLHSKLVKTKLIIAPHDLNRVAHLQTLFPDAILYSNINHVDITPLHNVLIIDCIGLLSKLYSYADVAIVGGGFHTSGLHNILEAAAFGVPVFFGDQYRKNPEADALIAANGAKSFEDEFDLAVYVEELIKTANRTPENETSYLKEMSDNAGFFIASQPNAKEKIIKKINDLMAGR